MLLYLSHKHTEIVNTHILMLIYSVEIIDITQHVEYYDTQTKGRGQCSCNLGCVCFGWKSLPEMLFRKWGCLVGPENSIFWKLKSVDPKKKPLTTEIDLHFYFPFKAFPENERERESTRAREEKWRTRSRRREIAPLVAISRRRDRAVDRDLASARSRRREIWEVVACVSGFVFSFFFSKHQKIFSGKFFEMQPNTWKYFPFPEISISGKYVFSRKRFTATKHSLSHKHTTHSTGHYTHNQNIIIST